MLEMVGSKCTGCCACANICKQFAIIMEENEEGFLYPYIDKNRCVKCHQCENTCPVLHPPMKNTAIKAYASYCKDEKKHRESSSGGIFTLLAEKAIADKGMAVGAAFDDRFQVKHIVVDELGELRRLKGSKYVQSHIGSVFQQVKEQLERGRTVVFSGTLCQIAGLRSYLGREYPNLLCVDLFCHGVPSYRVLQKSIKDMFSDDIPKEMIFRDKTNGIDNTTLNYYFMDRVVQEEYSESSFIKGFTQGMYLRQSCYQCPFKGIDRCSDITIGDFWGIKKAYPDFVNKYGVSAVIIQNEKGKMWFDRIKDSTCFMQVNIQTMLPANHSVCFSATYNPKREIFFKRYISENTSELINELYDPHYWDELFTEKSLSICKRIIRKIGSLLSRGIV